MSEREPWPWQKPKADSRPTRKAPRKSSKAPAKRAARPDSATPGGGSGSGGRRRPPSKGKKKMSRRKKIALWIGGVIGGFFLLGIVGFAVAYAATDVPAPNRDFQTATSYVYYDDGKTVLGKFATQDRDPVDLDQMGDFTAHAVVAAEDRTFYTNSGIDIKGIIRAARSNATSGEIEAGGSTITQQYVKVLYLTSERSYKRKMKEALVSLKLQRTQSKNEILQGYLNTIYFGRGAYGIQAAAQHYFNISATELNLQQSAALAAIINSPNANDPATSETAPARLLARYQYVLDGMLKLDYISQAEHDQAYGALPEFPKVKNTSGKTGQQGYVMDMVRNELHELGYSDAEIDGSGFRITTTISKKVMKSLSTAVDHQRPKDKDELHIGIATVDVQTSALKGIYAGDPYETSNGGTNWAMTGAAPGSSFKTFALAAGMKAGFSLKSTFFGNSPFKVGNTWFNNAGDGHGEQLGKAIPLLTATQHSINTSFVDLTNTIGPQKVIDTAVDMGIPDCGSKCGLDPGAGVALGSADIRPVDMANGYATVASGGKEKPWFLVQEITNGHGSKLFTHTVRAKQVLDEPITNDITFALQSVLHGGTGGNATAIGRPAAGKTGTATDDNDDTRAAWFVGYTPQLSTAVMYVRGDGNDPLNGYLSSEFGGYYPAKTWAEAMKLSLDGEDVVQLPKPSNVKATRTDHSATPQTCTAKDTPYGCVMPSPPPPCTAKGKPYGCEVSSPPPTCTSPGKPYGCTPAPVIDTPVTPPVTPTDTPVTPPPATSTPTTLPTCSGSPPYNTGTPPTCSVPIH